MLRFASALTLVVAMTGLSNAAAQDGGLLDQAVAEEQHAAGAGGADTGALLDEADALLKQRKFDEAIGLYTRAYRQAPNDQNAYIRLLAAKRAAGRLTAEDRQALELIQSQQNARIEQTFGGLRLDLLQAREALREGDRTLAEAKLAHARELIESLPPYVDAAIYERQVRSLSQSLARKADRSAPKAKASREPVGQTATPPSPPAVQLVEQDPGGEPLAPDPAQTGEIIDVRSLMDYDHERHAYERHLDRALRRNRADWLLRNTEAAIVPLEDMTFPHDWPDRVARRAPYRDSVIFEGQPFTGEDGQTRQSVLYDLGDLVHPVPNFYATYPGTAREQRIQDMDRAYLRMGSFIFNGYPEDLAYGLPLLHFFGGIDHNAVSSRTDPNETERIVQIIERFINR